jgi:lipopolysaccharide biosynthesis protein
MKIGIFCHMFYPKLFVPLWARLEQIPVQTDLYISTGTPDPIISVLFHRWQGSVNIRTVENRGRDVAPRLVTFAKDHEPYDLILHVHTKGSHDQWREHLLDRLLPSPEGVIAIIDQFRLDPALGIVAPEHWPAVMPWINWGESNLDHARRLATRARIEFDPDDLDFPSGSMFWARPAAIMPLLNLGLSFDDFPEEAGQFDGTIAHAIERLWYYAAANEGFTCQTVSLQNGHVRFSHSWPRAGLLDVVGNRQDLPVGTREREPCAIARTAIPSRNPQARGYRSLFRARRTMREIHNYWF